MPRRAPIRSLLFKVTDFIVEKIDLYFKCYYNRNLKSYTYDHRPSEGPFGNIPSTILLNIITKLAKKKRLYLKHLLVLLPHDGNVGYLICDHMKALTAYKPHLLELILYRCPYLQVLHYHSYKGTDYECFKTIDILNFFIPHLYLKTIDFHDSRIGDETLKVIAATCIALKTLILNHTDVTDRGIEYLVNSNSVIKNSLTTLALDFIPITAESVAKVYLHLTNLQYFVSDVSIFAGIRLLEARLESPSTYGNIFIAKTTVLKSSFNYYDISFPNIEIFRWFIYMFSNVTNLVLTEIKMTDACVINELIPQLGKINHLQLSAEIIESACPLSALRKSIAACGGNLLCLKIEKFDNVDVFHLGIKCQKLKRLLLINNTYNCVENVRNLNLFQNLVELQVILLLDYEIPEGYNVYLTENAFFSMMLSSQLKKILVICQMHFSENLIRKLVARSYLRNLEEIYIYECINISRETIWIFVRNLERIKIIEVGLIFGITEVFIKNVREYIKNNNYDVSVSLIDEIPVPVRWYVVDLPLGGKNDVFFEDHYDYAIGRLFH